MTNVETSPQRRRTWPLVVGLLLLSPVCAEYLIGYDESIGDPVALVTGLIILAPLYGAPAVLIREVVRRVNRGWPSIFIMSAAFGLAQAGIIDQSLFHLEFGPDAPEWANEHAGTVMPLLGINADQMINFVGGHIIWTFAAPIAMIESYSGRAADQPWLKRVGVGVLAALYLTAALLILGTVEVPASAPQLVLTGLVVLALAMIALRLPNRRRPAMPATAPSPWIAGLAAFVLLAASQVVPTDWGWAGVACISLSLSVLGVLLIFWSQHTGWDRQHVLTVAAAALMARAVLSFAVEPLGHVVYPMKYTMNAAILVLILTLSAGAAIRLQRTIIGER